MRFLARFASAVDLECFRVDELRAVCGLLGIRNWRIEGDTGDDSAILMDALILDKEVQEASAKAAKDFSSSQPLGNHKNFYGGVVTESSPRQPLNIVFLHFESISDAVAVASRCVLLKGVSLLFDTAPSIDELIQRVQGRLDLEGSAEGGDQLKVNAFTNPTTTDVKSTMATNSNTSSSSSSTIQVVTSGPNALLAPLLIAGYSFKYTIESVCWTIQGAEKLDIINQFAAVPHLGQVQLSKPNIVFEVVMLYQHLNNPQARGIVPKLLGTAFTVPVAISSRTLILERYALNRRPYIGTTSMPPELTFLMANLAQVRSGFACYDPFCGTGSSLVTCAHFGAIAYGSDIDGQAMRGGSAKFKQSKQILQQQKLAMKHYLPHCLKENGGVIDAAEAEHPTVLTNFKLYGLQPPERMRFDFSLWGALYDQRNSAYTLKTVEDTETAAAVVGCKRPRDSSKPFLFDAILSDPPYGIREQKLQTMAAGSEDASGTSASTSASPVIIEGDSSSPHHTAANMAQEDYDISTMIVDLILFAGVHLAAGRRIVFWHPTTYLYTPDELPRHPYLRIVLARPQMLSLKFVRVLVVMERVVEPLYLLPDGVTGPLSVTKEILFPNQITASLRRMLDATELDDNEAYTQYRANREQKRESAKSYWKNQEELGPDAAALYNTTHVHAHGRASTKKVAPVIEVVQEGEMSKNMSKRALARQKAQVNIDNRERKLAAAASASAPTTSTPGEKDDK